MTPEMKAEIALIAQDCKTTREKQYFIEWYMKYMPKWILEVRRKRTANVSFNKDFLITQIVKSING